MAKSIYGGGSSAFTSFFQREFQNSRGILLYAGGGLPQNGHAQRKQRALSVHKPEAVDSKTASLFLSAGATSRRDARAVLSPAVPCLLLEPARRRIWPGISMYAGENRFLGRFSQRRSLAVIERAVSDVPDDARCGQRRSTTWSESAVRGNCRELPKNEQTKKNFRRIERGRDSVRTVCRLARYIAKQAGERAPCGCPPG